MIALVLAVVVINPTPDAPAERLIAALAPNDSDARFVALYDTATDALTVTRVAGDRPEDRDFELWLIAGDDPPVSLGLIDPRTGGAPAVPAGAGPAFAAGATLAVSLEPLGGSPHRRPDRSRRRPRRRAENLAPQLFSPPPCNSSARRCVVAVTSPRRRGHLNPQGEKFMSLRTLTLSAIVAAFGITAAHAENPMVGGAPMFQTRNIIENAVNSKDHTTLVAAVQAAGLVETLQGEGPFTVFAPVNDAFDALPDGTVETLLKPENKDQLTKILTCHVVAANAMSTAINKMIADDGGRHQVKTVGGCEFTTFAKDGKLMIEDGVGNVAAVTIADVQQSNGVIHVIDTVLLPAAS